MSEIIQLLFLGILLGCLIAAFINLRANQKRTRTLGIPVSFIQKNGKPFWKHVVLPLILACIVSTSVTIREKRSDVPIFLTFLVVFLVWSCFFVIPGLALKYVEWKRDGLQIFENGISAGDKCYLWSEIKSYRISPGDPLPHSSFLRIDWKNGSSDSFEVPNASIEHLKDLLSKHSLKETALPN